MSTIIDLISTVSISTGTAASDSNHSGSDSSSDQAGTTASSSPEEDSPEFAIIGGLLLLVVALAAVVGNILVILSVYTNRKLRTITNLFVVSLAVADLMVGALVLPPAVKKQITQSWGLGTAICDIWISLDVLLCTASILNLCCISIDRYFAITRPLDYATKRNRRHASVMIGAVWCLSAVITSPPLLGWKEKNRSTDGKTCELTKEKGYVVYSAMGSFYIPLAIMIFVYVNIFVVARNAQRRWRGSQTGKSVSLCSLIKEALPVSMKSSPPGGEERKKVLRVSTTRSSSSSSARLCCCLGDIYWSEAVVADGGDWRVSRGHPQQHVTRSSCSGQVEIVTYGDSRWVKPVADDPGTASVATVPAAVTSPETDDAFSVVKDVISGTKNTRETVRLGADASMTFKERSNDQKVNRRRHSFTDRRSCAHAQTEPEVVESACSKEESSCKRKQFRRSDSLPAHAPKSRDHHHRGVTSSEDMLLKNMVANETADKTEETRHEPPLPVDPSSEEAFATVPRWKRKMGPSSTDQRKSESIPALTGGQSSTRSRPTTTTTPFQRLRLKTAQRRENSTVLRERKTAKTVSIVVGCFVLCWLPFFIVYIAEPFFADKTFNDTMKKWFVWLGYFNSVINPFIYAFYNHDFRFTFWRLTLGRFWGSKRLPRGIAPSSPNNVTRFHSGQKERSVSGGERTVVEK